MKRRQRRFFVRLALVGLAGLGALSAGDGARAENCTIPAPQARQLIAGQGLISAGEAGRIAAAQAGGRAFYVKLCRSGGRYYYKVNVMQGGNRLTTVKVNASR